MTRFAHLTTLLGLLGLLLAVSQAAEQAEEKPRQPFDLYRLDWDDSDSILAMSDSDMFHEMHSADRPDEDTWPDFSRVDDDLAADDDDEQVVVSRSRGAAEPTRMMAAESDDDGGADDEDKGEWQEPKNKMDLVRFFNGLYYQKQYGRINEFLVDKVGSANVAANMVEIGSWLELEHQAGKNMFLNQATTEALEQFYNLTRVLDEDVRCSRHSYAILWKNDRATGGKAHKPPSKLTPPRRVEAIAHQVFLRHSVECYHVYPKKYAQIRAAMEPSKRALVENVLDNVLGNVDCVASRIRSLADQKDAAVARHVIESIQRHSHEDPDRRYLGKVVDERRGRMAVQADKVGQLVERYLVEPCRYFVRTLGPDVFIPARFDALSLEKEDRYQGTSRELVEFLHGWLHYRLCDSLITRDAKQVTQAVVALIEKESQQGG